MALDSHLACRSYLFSRLQILDLVLTHFVFKGGGGAGSRATPKRPSDTTFVASAAYLSVDVKSDSSASRNPTTSRAILRKKKNGKFLGANLAVMFDGGVSWCSLASPGSVIADGAAVRNALHLESRAACNCDCLGGDVVAASVTSRHASGPSHAEHASSLSGLLCWGEGVLCGASLCKRRRCDDAASTDARAHTAAQRRTHAVQNRPHGGLSDAAPTAVRRAVRSD